MNLPRDISTARLIRLLKSIGYHKVLQRGTHIRRLRPGLSRYSFLSRSHPSVGPRAIIVAVAKANYKPVDVIVHLLTLIRLRNHRFPRHRPSRPTRLFGTLLAPGQRPDNQSCRQTRLYRAETPRPTAAQYSKSMELIFEVRDAEEGGYFARALGHGVFTEAETWDELRANVREAVDLHFEDEPARPRLVQLHYVKDELMDLEAA